MKILHCSLICSPDQYEISMEDQLEHKEKLEHMRESLEAIREDLNPREAFLLENRLLSEDPLTLQEIGQKYSVSREAIRQTEDRLKQKIKKKADKKKPRLSGL